MQGKGQSDRRKARLDSVIRTGICKTVTLE